QAEDGIRDFHVTGVQTCALPIYGDEETGGRRGARYAVENMTRRPDWVVAGEQTLNRICVGERGGAGTTIVVHGRAAHAALPWEEIGRASCREGVQASGLAVIEQQ